VTKTRYKKISKINDEKDVTEKEGPRVQKEGTYSPRKTSCCGSMGREKGKETGEGELMLEDYFQEKKKSRHCSNRGENAKPLES